MADRPVSMAVQQPVFEDRPFAVVCLDLADGDDSTAVLVHCDGAWHRLPPGTVLDAIRWEWPPATFTPVPAPATIAGPEPDA